MFLMLFNFIQLIFNILPMSVSTRHVQKGGGGGGGGGGLEPLPFSKLFKSASRTNSNDIVVNKTKCI